MPLTPVSGTIVRSAAGAPFKCGGIAAVGGECAVQTNKLELENPGDAPVGVVVLRPVPWLRPHRSRLRAGHQAAASREGDAPLFFDFAPGESHSLVFDVDKPGLFNVSTQGLLSMGCALRTPVIPDVAKDQSGGRGRNCLVAGYLRPGKYMMTRATAAPSRGRASVLLTRRPRASCGAVSADGDAFFASTPASLCSRSSSSASPGPSSSPPPRKAPASAALPPRRRRGLAADDRTDVVHGSAHVREGRLLMDAAAADGREHAAHAHRERPPRRCSRETSRTPVDFFTWYQARLGSDGKDELTFKLDGAAEVDIVLTNGMQGRLFLLPATSRRKPSR